MVEGLRDDRILLRLLCLLQLEKVEINLRKSSHIGKTNVTLTITLGPL